MKKQDGTKVHPAHSLEKHQNITNLDDILPYILCQ